MWEPAGAVALSIFLTVSLFLTVYGLAYVGIKICLKMIKDIKRLIKETKEEE